MGEFIKRFFNLEERILDDTTPKRKGVGRLIDKLLFFWHRNPVKTSIIPSLAYGAIFSNILFHYYYNYYKVLSIDNPRYKELIENCDVNFSLNPKLTAFWTVGLVSMSLIQSTFHKYKKDIKNIDSEGYKKNVNNLSNKIERAVKILVSLGLVYTELSNISYINEISSKANIPEIHNHSRDFTKYCLYSLSASIPFTWCAIDTLFKSVKIIGSKFSSRKQLIKSEMVRYLNKYKHIWNSNKITSRIYNKLNSKLRKKITDSLVKHNYNINLKKISFYLSISQNEVKDYALLEKSILKVKLDQEKNQKYVNLADSIKLLDLAEHINTTALYIYNAATLNKDYKQLSELLIQKLEKKYIDSLRVQSEISLFNSIFSINKLGKSIDKVLELMDEQKNKKQIFGTEKKVTLYEFDSETGRVVAESDSDFFERFLLARLAYSELLKKDCGISTEFPVHFFQKNGTYSSLSLLIHGQQLAEALKKQQNHKAIFIKLGKSLIQYQQILTKMVSNNNEFYAETDYFSNNYRISIPVMNLSDQLEKRCFGRKKNDVHERFEKNSQSEALLAELAKYERIFCRDSEFVFSHGDLSSYNILFGQEGEKTKSFIDFNPIMAPSIYDIATLAMQAETELSLDDKRDVLLALTGKDIQAVDYFLLNRGLCEAGSDLGHSRDNEKFKRKVNELAELARNKPYEHTVRKFLESSRCSAPYLETWSS